MNDLERLADVDDRVRRLTQTVRDQRKLLIEARELTEAVIAAKALASSHPANVMALALREKLEKEKGDG